MCLNLIYYLFGVSFFPLHCVKFSTSFVNCSGDLRGGGGGDSSKNIDPPSKSEQVN